MVTGEGKRQLLSAAVDVRIRQRENKVCAGGTKIAADLFHVAVRHIVFLQISPQQRGHVYLERVG